MKLVLITLMFTVFFGTHGKVKEHTVNGLLIGTEVDGMRGYIVGNETVRAVCRARNDRHRLPHRIPHHYDDCGYSNRWES